MAVVRRKGSHISRALCGRRARPGGRRQGNRASTRGTWHSAARRCRGPWGPETRMGAHLRPVEERGGHLGPDVVDPVLRKSPAQARCVRGRDWALRTCTCAASADVRSAGSGMAACKHGALSIATDCMRAPLQSLCAQAGACMHLCRSNRTTNGASSSIDTKSGSASAKVLR